MRNQCRIHIKIKIFNDCDKYFYSDVIYILKMSDEHEFIYYEDDSDYLSETSSEEEYAGMSGGIRETKYVQSGTNNVSDPYHYNEMMGIASAGGRSKHLQRLAKAGEIMSIASTGGKKQKIGKAIGNVSKSVGKAVIKEAKPIIIAEGKNQLKQGIKNMLESEQPSGAGLKRGRGRPRKNPIIPQNMVSTQDGGKRSLGKKLGALMPDDLIEEGFKRGIEYAKQMSGGKFKLKGVNPHSFGFKNTQDLQQQNKSIKDLAGGKFHIGKIGKSMKKIAGNEYAQDLTSGAVGLGVDAVAGPVAGLGAGVATKAAMKKASGGRRGGGASRGQIVGKIMREKGLSLAAASKFVKEQGLY